MNVNEFFSDDPNEKPLDHFPKDGGTCGILRRVACIGDSLDSGEMEIFDAENKRHCIDKFEFSWLSTFARLTGNEIFHFTRGGMSTKEFVETFGYKCGAWDRKNACNAYVITLGANDISMMCRNELEFGSLDDIDLQDYHNNKKTYTGYYATIIQRYREICPKCRIFLAIVFQKPTPERLVFVEKQRQLLREFTKLFEFTYVMDFYQYAPEFTDDEFRKKFYMNGHMSPLGYLLKGRIYTAYIDYIIRHNLNDFTQVAMIGDTLHDPKYVW